MVDLPHFQRKKRKDSIFLMIAKSYFVVNWETQNQDLMVPVGFVHLPQLLDSVEEGIVKPDPCIVQGE